MIVHNPDTNQYHWEDDPAGPVINLVLTREELEIVWADVSHIAYENEVWHPADRGPDDDRVRRVLRDRLKLMKAHLEAPACHHP